MVSEGTANKVIWNWTSDPFGATATNEDPDGDGVKFTYNLRFPGQYYDRETGLHYNYFRDYDPKIGRYVESDPIGLGGGINTYSYVNNKPLRASDPLGLYSLFGPNEQLPGCDFFPDFNKCAAKCCDEHDRCYERNGCNMLSWGVSGGILSHVFFACARCNHEAVICLAKAAIKCDDCKK